MEHLQGVLRRLRPRVPAHPPPAGWFAVPTTSPPPPPWPCPPPRQAPPHLGGHAPRAAPLLHALRHLELHVLVQIADRRHARSFVDRLLDLRRNGDILENEAGHLEPVLR